MTSEENRFKNRGGRPALLVKRNTTTGVRFTPAELNIVENKAKTAGVKMSTYIRQMSLNGNILARMNEEERKIFRQLVSMSNNINQLAKKAHQEGLVYTQIDFEKYCNELNSLLKQLKK